MEARKSLPFYWRNSGEGLFAAHSALSASWCLLTAAAFLLLVDTFTDHTSTGWRSAADRKASRTCVWQGRVWSKIGLDSRSN